MIHTCHKLVLQTNPIHQIKSSRGSSFKLRRRLWRSNHEEEEEEEEEGKKKLELWLKDTQKKIHKKIVST
jgi:hypothetical protein